MKKIVKPIVFTVLLVVLAALLVIPSGMTAKDIQTIPGKSREINGIPACFCPDALQCYCVVLIPPKD